MLEILSSPRRGRSLHDQVFKGLIGTFLADFVTLVAPEPAQRLDLSHWDLLDKEIFTDWPKGRRRELDLLAEVALADGSGRSALVHVEIEARFRPEIAPRLAGYAMQIRLRHNRPVLPLLLCLQRGRPGVHQEESALDTEIGPETWRFRYYSLGLDRCPAEEFLARDQPLAWALAALMRPSGLSRAQHKQACLRRIGAARLGELPRLLLANCVETYLELEGRDAEEWEALQAQSGTEERAMRAVKLSWAEKLIEQGREKGIEQGREQGIEKGREEGIETGLARGLELFRQTLLRQLALRFGPLPEDVRQRVAAIGSVERLSQMAEQILVARSFEEMGLR